MCQLRLELYIITPLIWTSLFIYQKQKIEIKLVFYDAVIFKIYFVYFTILFSDRESNFKMTL